MRFKYGIRKFDEKKSIISFIRNFGQYDNPLHLMYFIRQHNRDGNRVLILIKGE